MYRTEISKALWEAVNIAGSQVGFNPKDFSTFPMHVRSDISLLLDRVDTDTIRITEMWLIDSMMRYLHILSQNFTAGMTICMVQHGDYNLIPPDHGG